MTFEYEHPLATPVIDPPLQMLTPGDAIQVAEKTVLRIRHGGRRCWRVYFAQAMRFMTPSQRTVLPSFAAMVARLSGSPSFAIGASRSF